MVAAVAIVVVLVAGVVAVVVTRTDEDGRRAASTTTAAATTVPTPDDVEDLRPLRWRAELGQPVGRRIGVSGELILATVGGNELVALDGTGTVVWSRRLQHPSGDVPPGVLVRDDLVLTRSVAAGNDEIELHRAGDGALLWTAPIGFAGYGDHQAVITDDLVVANGSSELRAWDRTTGAEVWSLPAHGLLYGLSLLDDEVYTLDQDTLGGVDLVRVDVTTGTESGRESLGSTQVDPRWPLLPGAPETAVTLDRGEWAQEFRPLDLAEGRASTSGTIALDLDITGLPLAVVGDTLLVSTAETYSLSAFAVRTGTLRWASGHAAFEATVDGDTLLARGLDLVRIDLDDGGATVLARDLEQTGGPPIPGPDGTILVPDETGIQAYG